MKIKIYNQAGELKETVSPSTSSRWSREIGSEYVVSLSFKTWKYFMLDVNDYILVRGCKFKIKKEYLPKQLSTQEYSYQVTFYGREHDAEDIKLCRLTQGEDDLEVTFAYEATPQEMLAKVVQNLNRNTDGIVWKVGEAIEAARRTFEFNDVFCWDGLNDIASQLETEWWLDGDCLNLCKCERGEPVSLGYMQGLTSLTQQENSNTVKFFTRLIPRGSTRNIDRSKYGYDRLQLPSRVKYLDRNTQYGLKEHVEESAFTEIYPHYLGTVASERHEEKENDNGKYTVYYINDNDLMFDPNNYEIGGMVKHIVFQSGNLKGKDFEVNFHSDTKEFEIINIYPDEESQLPGGNLIPESGDTYIPYNFSLPDEYYPPAEREYEAAVNKFLTEYSRDTSVYQGNTDYIYIDTRNVPLILGQRIRLLSREYFGKTGYRDSRITKISCKLENLSCATVDCCNVVGRSWKSSVESSINSLKYTIASTTGGNEGGTLNPDNAATIINDIVRLKKNILVNSPKVGYLETGYVLMAGMTWEEVLRTMLYKTVGAQLTGKLSTANDVEFGSEKGTITYSSTRNGHGPIKEAWIDGDKNRPLAFGAEVEGVQVAKRVLSGYYTTNETYRADVTYMAAGSLKEATLTDKISVNVRRRWFAGVCSSVPANSAQVRALSANGLYTGGGSYKFSAGQWKTVVICIPDGNINDISVTAYPGNFIEDTGVCSGPKSISVEGANGSAAVNYKMWVIKAETTNDADTFTFKTN